MKFLVSLKNPPLTYLVDSCDDKMLEDLPHVKFNQNGVALIIPILATSNITSIKEITDKAAKKWQEAAREANRKASLDTAGIVTKPDLIIPRGNRGFQ